MLGNCKFLILIFTLYSPMDFKALKIGPRVTMNFTSLIPLQQYIYIYT